MTEYANSREVNALVPLVYRNSVREFRFHPNTDMSRSYKCHTMTLDLLGHLGSGNLAVRRELHVLAPEGLWHYVVAHTAPDALPSDEDVITDMNPWYWKGAEQLSGFLHAPRRRIIQTLQDAGAPDSIIALRSLATLTHAHNVDLLPPWR